MKRLRWILALLLPTLLGLAALTACTPGDLGSEEIAFLRDGRLWTINPNGANAFTVVTQNTPVLGYGLSPDHRIFVFRTLDGTFAQTFAGRHLPIDPITGLTGDVPGTLNTVGIDGGSPIPIIISGSHLTESDAWWSPDGNRLLYREGANPPAWWIAQSDQPLGIARKSLPLSYSIPSITTDGKTIVENADNGIFTTDRAGEHLTIVRRGNLTGHPLPASLERVLWQPAHAHPALLYALALTPQGEGASNQDQIALMLRLPGGEEHELVRCACRQFAWSSDGNAVLYSTAQGYTVLTIQDGASFHFEAEHGAVPYWSPNGQALLLDGLHTLTLVKLASRQTQVLLSDGHVPVMSDGPLPDSNAALQPVTNSPWNIDGRRFVLVTRGRTQWLGQSLHAGNGLYLVTLNNHDEPQSVPALLDLNDHDTQPSWSYVNQNTSFLF